MKDKKKLKTGPLKVLKSKKMNFKDFVFWIYTHLNEKGILVNPFITDCTIYDVPEELPIFEHITSATSHLFGFPVKDLWMERCRFRIKK